MSTTASDRQFVSPSGVHAPFGYAHVVRAGATVYAAGQVGIDPDGNVLEGFDVQARQAFGNLQTVLASVGASLKDIVKVLVLLADLDDLAGYRAVRDDYIPHHPASTLHVVKALAIPGLLFEIEATAVVSQDEAK